MTVSADCTLCVPYDIDMGCCDELGSTPSALLCRATTLAWSTLRTLSGGRVGNCPVTLRPCASTSCSTCLPGVPVHVRSGECGGCWTSTVPCAADGCSCTQPSEVRMPGEVAEVAEVWLDGQVLDESKYRLDNGRLLVRTDGGSWPGCQNTAASLSESGTFGVVYVPGVIPGSAGEWAAGVLTCEFIKACTGQKCRLPSSVTSLTRQGVTMETSRGMFPDGLTGIREVDAYLTALNPNHLMTRPKVWSPDLPPYRAQGMP